MIQDQRTEAWPKVDEDKRRLLEQELRNVRPVVAELAALRAENAALKEQIRTNNDDASRIISDLRAQVTRLQEASTAELMKHREERTVLRATLKHISDELYERSDVEDDGRGGQRMNWCAELRVYADAALSATTGGKEARDARSTF